MMPGMDYYAVHPSRGGDGPEGLLVEEFALDADHVAVRLDSAGWSPRDGRWWPAARFSRAVRADPAVRRRVAPLDRAGAAALYARLGGGRLPAEAALRGGFRDGVPLPVAAPLRLTEDASRTYRVLFAGDLPPSAHPPLPAPASLRRLAAVAAWAVDVPAPAGDVAPVLRAVTATMRSAGLVPVTIERLS